MDERERELQRGSAQWSPRDDPRPTDFDLFRGLSERIRSGYSTSWDRIPSLGGHMVVVGNDDLTKMALAMLGEDVQLEFDGNGFLRCIRRCER